MEKQKVYVMEADKVVAEASVESMTISVKDLKEQPGLEFEDYEQMLFTNSFSMKEIKRSFRKFITRELKRYGKFVRQMEALRRCERDYLVIRRCMWYGDRVPRKYRRAYGEVIRSLARMENLREVLGRPRV